MSDSDTAPLQIGCPECERTVDAAVPPGTGLGSRESRLDSRKSQFGSRKSQFGSRKSQFDSRKSRGPTSLRGVERTCGNCGHELDIYYY